MINSLQFIQNLFAIAGRNVSNYITYLHIGHQEFAYDINVMSC